MTDKQMSYPEFVPSVAAYVAAFKKIKASMNDRQRDMLRKHHDVPGRVMTATELGQSVGFVDHRGTNSQYGRLGKMLGEAMGIQDLAWNMSMLAICIAPGAQTNEHWLLVMRENVALALEEVGLSQKTSRFFFPDGAPPEPTAAESEGLPAE